ncbi:hypothetical protein [Pelagerythrobacter rhizovicinus]|uniref:DUF3887 domain-containing protein n=1 Tax=Pelagerythrobacter rhizovicinus TaxID=2268576 RepID=A0A4Q2KLL2_9SPHN|nr:hypothetical protein [Pelagerythrobacter rhizovicinus]RXZ65329.1 hypothetical protein ETX26_00770 [Pelagerythrobacter rhizovicinus]
MQPSRLAPRQSAALLAALALALAACDRANGDADPQANDMTVPEAPAPPTAAEAPPQGVAADRSPVADTGATLVPQAEKGEPGARKVLLDFARAIEFEDFDRAYAILGDAARESMTYEEFRAIFDGMDEITVATPMGRMEGGAGSLYYEVPTTITAKDGASLRGAIVLRRVNDVPGATAEQLRWHIESFTVEPG